MKFFWSQQVNPTRGFYRGQTGTITDVIQPSWRHPFWVYPKYKVTFDGFPLSRKFDVWIWENELQAVPEAAPILPVPYTMA